MMCISARKRIIVSLQFHIAVIIIRLITCIDVFVVNKQCLNIDYIIWYLIMNFIVVASIRIKYVINLINKKPKNSQEQDSIYGHARVHPSVSNSCTLVHNISAIPLFDRF